MSKSIRAENKTVKALVKKLLSFKVKYKKSCHALDLFKENVTKNDSTWFENIDDTLDGLSLSLKSASMSELINAVENCRLVEKIWDFDLAVIYAELLLSISSNAKDSLTDDFLEYISYSKSNKLF